MSHTQEEKEMYTKFYFGNLREEFPFRETYLTFLSMSRLYIVEWEDD
jgi:trans-aconitate methyltransferase